MNNSAPIVPPQAHGTRNGYAYYKCRCGPCIEANNAHARKRYRAKKGWVLFSTLCADCDSTRDTSYAEIAEEEWENHTIEVDEYKCRSCKEMRHWWYFVINRVTYYQ